MRSIKSFIPVALAIITAASLQISPVFAQATSINADNAKAGKAWNHKKGDGHRKEMFKELNLTDAQKKQFKSIHEAFRTQNKAAFDTMKSTHQQLKQLRQAGKQNTPEFAALKSQLEQQHQAFKPQRDAMKNQLRTILTPEQQSKWDAMKAEHMKKFEGKRHHNAG